ncbi:haspin protein kinase [Vittaforma corneae ATCC 50505]|uniref:non-specific serine/threonine protein kinase n=1 Tax=Vittaforma corneae (strain ATCC 50505) TaxID=993615 RepID=L2GM34_VITCO|nr:haspin protein kinase [Vittaforma corneae ATCC 50505]ELA41684.1 haspin protein kinase [Vittaforma corneae ATCC 50505]
MTSRENIYSCFKDCDKYLTDSAKTIKNSEMDELSSSGAINDKNIHKNGVLRRFSSHSFDRDGETALFVNETIKNRIISEKVELEPTPKSVHGIGVSSSQVNIKIASMPKQDRLCKLQIRSKTKEDNSDAYSFEELKAMLNLRTVTFDEMPSNPVKIGEASFSEVYKIGNLIYKIIPFNQWYSIESFCKEAFILDVLKSEAGVCKLVDRLLIKGGYSQEYLRAWDSFANGDNPRPSQSNDDQLYGVLVMNDCGCDLEKYRFKNFTEVVDFIDQLLSAICSLEERFKFEHRDMHWGNIMIKNSMVYIIDFNFARLETDKIVYTDLNAQEWLFEGDRSVDMQFEIYVEARKACKSNWKAFSPKSNLLWVRYLLRKLELKLETFKEDVGSAKKIQNKRMLGKITQKAYEFADCKGFRKYFDMFISKNNLKPLSNQ